MATVSLHAPLCYCIVNFLPYPNFCCAYTVYSIRYVTALSEVLRRGGEQDALSSSPSHAPGRNH